MHLPISNAEKFVNFVYDNVKNDPSLVYCDLDQLYYRYYLEILYAMVDNESFFHINGKSIVKDGAIIKYRKGYLEHITEILTKRYNYQNGAYNLFYMNGLDFPTFRKLPVSVKKEMTLKNIPKATRMGVKKRFNSTIKLLSLIIIFRTTCHKFEELNGYGSGTSNKVPHDGGLLEILVK